MTDTTTPKGAKARGKEAEGPLLSFDEFLARTNLAPAWATGLEMALNASSGPLPRSLEGWNKALADFQSQS